MDGWISIHRKIKEWEWYTDPNPMRLFIHCLLSANYEPKKWRGIEINRGEFITSIQNLSKELKLSVKQIRVAINKLKETNEVAIKTTSQYTMIQVIKYDEYQIEGKREDKRRANEGQTKGKRRATTNNKNNNNNYNNILMSQIVEADLDESIKEYYQIAISFYRMFENRIIESGAKPTVLRTAKGTWIDDVRKMMQYDGVTLENLRSVFQFLQKDDFWSKNILSISTLRKQFPKLIIQANGTKRNPKEGCTWAEFDELIARKLGSIAV